MSDIDAFIRDRFEGKSKSSGGDGIYTGAYTALKLKSEDSVALRACLDQKGKLVAIIYGDRILPFVVEQVSREQVASHQAKYRKGLAGLIDQIHLRVPRP